MDFISAIPLDVILIYGFNQRYMTDVRDTNVGVNSIVVRLIVRGMKILRLLKSINIMKAFDRFEKVRTHTTQPCLHYTTYMLLWITSYITTKPNNNVYMYRLR